MSDDLVICEYCGMEISGPDQQCAARDDATCSPVPEELEAHPDQMLFRAIDDHLENAEAFVDAGDQEAARRSFDQARALLAYLRNREVTTDE